MKSLYNFVIQPVGQRYNNSKKINNKELILNTEVYNHQFVNRKAKVISCPRFNNTKIQPGDIVIVHHNVFRRWHDIKGIERNSKAWLSEDNYVVCEDQIYLYKSKDQWKPIHGFCFVQPLLCNKELSADQTEDPDKGVVVYSDGEFEVGEIVGYTPFSKYEFVIDGQRLYRVYNKYITTKYERKGNEKTYNPSWAQGS
jgi:hypothetical protein